MLCLWSFHIQLPIIISNKLYGSLTLKKEILVFFLFFLAIACFASGQRSSSEQVIVPSAGTQKTDEFSTSSDLIKVIMNSFTGRTFLERNISDDILEAILNSGQKAPSAMNAQPWHFTVIRNSTIARQLVPRDFREGTVVIIVSGTPDERRGVTVAFDTALATQNISLAALSLGLGTYLYYGGVQNINDNLKDTLGIPEGFDAQIIMLIGYLDNSVDTITSASQRRSLTDNVNYVD